MQFPQTSITLFQRNTLTKKTYYLKKQSAVNVRIQNYDIMSAVQLPFPDQSQFKNGKVRLLRRQMAEKDHYSRRKKFINEQKIRPNIEIISDSHPNQIFLIDRCSYQNTLKMHFVFSKDQRGYLLSVIKGYQVAKKAMLQHLDEFGRRINDNEYIMDQKYLSDSRRTNSIIDKYVFKNQQLIQRQRQKNGKQKMEQNIQKKKKLLKNIKRQQTLLKQKKYIAEDFVDN